MERKPEYLGDWWAIISTFEKVMWIIAIVASILFLFQMFIFYNTFLHSKEEEDDDYSLSFVETLISFKSIVVFFTFFSWGTLYAFNNIEFGIPISISIGIIAGALLSLGFTYVFTYFD